MCVFPQHRLCTNTVLWQQQKAVSELAGVGVFSPFCCTRPAMVCGDCPTSSNTLWRSVMAQKRSLPVFAIQLMCRYRSWKCVESSCRTQIIITQTVYANMILYIVCNYQLLNVFCIIIVVAILCCLYHSVYLPK